MAIHPDLLELLVCPVCKDPVALVGDEADATAGLKCGTCQRIYPIRDDIPVMLVSEARINE
jgi:uncharacterized protein YbaR (Trm112 family)